MPSVSSVQSKGEDPMFRLLTRASLSLGALLCLAACNPYDPGQCAVGGAGIGAGTGAAIGAAIGGGRGAAAGALIGGATGAATGVATTPPPPGYYPSGGYPPGSYPPGAY